MEKLNNFLNEAKQKTWMVVYAPDRHKNYSFGKTRIIKAVVYADSASEAWTKAVDAGLVTKNSYAKHVVEETPLRDIKNFAKSKQEAIVEFQSEIDVINKIKI